MTTGGSFEAWNWNAKRATSFWLPLTTTAYCSSGGHCKLTLYVWTLKIKLFMSKRLKLKEQTPDSNAFLFSRVSGWMMDNFYFLCTWIATLSQLMRHSQDGHFSVFTNPSDVLSLKGSRLSYNRSLRKKGEKYTTFWASILSACFVKAS